jgi:hypothetical protein
MNERNYIISQVPSKDVGLEYTKLALEHSPGVLLGIAITITAGFYTIKSFGLNKVIEKYSSVSEEILKGYMTLNANLEKLNDNLSHQGILLSNQINDVGDSINTHTDAEPARVAEMLKLGFTNHRIIDKLDSIQHDLDILKHKN